MIQLVSSSVILRLVVFLVHTSPSLSACPWDDPDLERWSEGSTWDSGRVPAQGDDVVIPTGKKVLLDGPIPRLLTLTINGVLVWADVDGIRLETSYVLVNGEFHIGSEDCNFEKKADIFLYGMSNSSEVVTEPGDFGRKFIGAAGGSKLEIHGKRKKSWSKLVATVRPIESGSCEVLYDSRTSRSSSQPGLHMTVWDFDGSLLDFQVLRTADGQVAGQEAQRMVDIINDLPESKVVGIAVYKTIGADGDNLNQVYTALESLGATQIRNVREFDMYSFVGVAGEPTIAVEKLTRRALYTKSYTDGIEARATLLVEGLAFSVISFAKEHSEKYETIFRVLSPDTAFPKLSLLHSVKTWEVGDEIVVVSTDFDWRQAEVRTIVQCSDCERNQIRVDGDFEFTHFGEVTFGVDERAEVGLLSRNVKIEAELQQDCYYFDSHEKDLCDKFYKDTYGGHVKILRGAWARIEGVELIHMGQQSTLAKYPLHFHMCDEVPGMYLRNNVVRDANSRCITVHGTDYLEVSDNVCLNHLGHGMFLEDSAEQHNTIHRNLVVGTLYGTLLLTDMRTDWCTNKDWCDLLSSIWITHPNNRFTENVAAGSDGFGIVLTFSDRPLGPSLRRQKERGLYREESTRYTKVAEFTKNVIHSNTHGGLWFDSRLSYGIQDGDTFIPENAEIGMNYYSPREPPQENGTRVETLLNQVTLYKNMDRNVWIRGGDIVFTNSTFADSPSSYVAAHTQDMTSVDVRNSIFIGQTANKGQPWTYVFNKEFPDLPKSERPRHDFDRSISEQKPSFPMGGVVFYQGPVYIDNCYFDQFFNWYYNDSMMDAWGYRPVRPASAITFHPNNHYPMIPRNGVSNLKFGFCDGSNNSHRFSNGNGSTPYWTVFDGTGNANIRDYDGSLTGTANTQVVQNRPFFTGPECLSKPDWGMAVCPYRYFMLIVRGKGGVLEKKYRGKFPVLISRDQQPDDVYAQKGEKGHKYIVRVNQSYTIRFNTSVGPSPREIQFRPRFGLENNEVVRLAVCLPKSTTTFSISSRVPRVKYDPLWVTSLAELDADTTMTAYFWDSHNGYLYLKMSSPYNLTTLDQECPDDQCLEVNIERVDGGDEPAECSAPVTPYVSQVPDPPTVEEPVCHGPDSPQGLGAPIEQGYHPPPPRATECPQMVSRSSLDEPVNYEARGCFSQSTERNDFSDEEITLKTLMIPEYCVERCRQRLFSFAGLHSGKVCTCADNVGRNGVSDQCTLQCSGDNTQICGGRWTDVSVFATGLALELPPQRCGVQSHGVVYQNACLYINYQEETYQDSLARCERLGGSLVKIDSGDKMRFVEIYLSDMPNDVWIGAKANGSTWMYLDGSVIDQHDYGNWRAGYLQPVNNRFLFMQTSRGFKWNSSSNNRRKMSLCELPVQVTASSNDDETPVCEDEECLVKVNTAMTYVESEIYCRSKYGHIATNTTFAERYLNSIDDRDNFWIGGNTADDGKQTAYSDRSPREISKFDQSEHFKTLCVIDGEVNGCPNQNWVRHGESCYFNTNMVVDTYFRAAVVCDSDRASILRVDSAAETDFIQSLTGTGGSVWLDLRYNSFVDAISRSDGTRPVETFWSSPDPLQALTSGLCVTLDLSTGLWNQTLCQGSKTSHFVVCEAAAL